MCRCEKPSWRLTAGPCIMSPAISQCENCKNLFYGYPEDAVIECTMWQTFFKILEEHGIADPSAQAQLWERHKNKVRRMLILAAPEELRSLIPQFESEAREITELLRSR